ncbi:MAG TPA: hypothetical protein VD833_22735 [Vicinamibacterales bacterium]|nr:hypothetical protein [Vicinamibacterales bacterium]
MRPGEAVHRLRAASVLARQKQFDEAIVQAQAWLRLADSDETRRRAQDMLDRLKSLPSKER